MPESTCSFVLSKSAVRKVNGRYNLCNDLVSNWSVWGTCFWRRWLKIEVLCINLFWDLLRFRFPGPKALQLLVCKRKEAISKWRDMHWRHICADPMRFLMCLVDKNETKRGRFKINRTWSYSFVVKDSVLIKSESKRKSTYVGKSRARVLMII